MKVSILYHPWTLFVAGFLILSIIPFQYGKPMGYMLGIWGGATLFAALIRAINLTPW